MTSRNKIYTHHDGRTFDLGKFIEGGRYNLYICTAGHHNLSLDLDEGVTPMFVICRRKHQHKPKKECGATASSAMYDATLTEAPAQRARKFLPVVLVWRRPNERELRVSPATMLEHWRKGGLQLEWVL